MIFLQLFETCLDNCHDPTKLQFTYGIKLVIEQSLRSYSDKKIRNHNWYVGPKQKFSSLYNIFDKPEMLMDDKACMSSFGYPHVCVYVISDLFDTRLELCFRHFLNARTWYVCLYFYLISPYLFMKITWSYTIQR